MSKRMVTVSTLVYTDGNETVCKVYRARLLGKPGARRVNLNAPTTVEVTSVHSVISSRAGSLIDHLKDLDMAYATPEAPAVDWAS